jgi:hypothetical protein
MRAKIFYGVLVRLSGSSFLYVMCLLIVYWSAMAIMMISPDPLTMTDEPLREARFSQCSTSQ